MTDVFPKLQKVKTWLEHSLKSRVSQQTLAVNMSKFPKCLQNFHESSFIMFFHHSHGR